MVPVRPDSAHTARRVPMWGGAVGGGCGETVGGVLPGADQDGDAMGLTE